MWLWFGSACWLLLVFSVAWFVFWPNIEGGKGLKPNEFGDLLAGAFSPLAFAWFVYAVFMQRQELELQRTELADTRSVLRDQEKSQKESASQSKRNAEATERQNELVEEELILDLHRKYLDSLHTMIFSFQNVALYTKGHKANILSGLQDRMSLPGPHLITILRENMLEVMSKSILYGPANRDYEPNFIAIRRAETIKSVVHSLKRLERFERGTRILQLNAQYGIDEIADGLNILLPGAE